LESIGLAAPQIAYLMRELRQKGFDIEENVFTVEQAKEVLVKLLKDKTV